MSEGINGAILAAMSSQQKNRAKSQRRKERAEKRKVCSEANVEDQPPTKKQKKSNSGIIRLTPEHRKFLGEFFHCTPFYNAATKSVGVFTGFDLTPCMYYVYPCLLGETTDKNGNPIKKKRGSKKIHKATDYVLACANPVNIFTGLREAFKILFPDVDETKYRKWEAFRLNNEYYTSKVSGQVVDFKTYIAELGESKVMGGAKPHKVVHVIEDIGVSRQLRAIHLEDHFAKVPFYNGIQTPIPANAHVNSVQLLQKIRDTTMTIKEAEKVADTKATELVKSKSFSEKINDTAQSESEEDYSSE